MSGPTTYRGNCHCKAFVFEVTLAKPLTTIYDCSCSICVKKNYAHILLQDDEKLNIVKGSLDDLSTYKFGTQYLHKFCPTCASPVMIVRPNPGPGANPAVNARCLQGPLDFTKLERKVFDGASLKPDYEAPAYTGTLPTGGPEDAKIYYGSCHCGAVRLAFRSKPFEKLDRDVDDDRVVDCNCSICVRNGYVWIYPYADQVSLQGEENMSHYEFSRHVNSKGFCKTCGVPMTNFATHYTPEELAKLPAAAQAADVIERRRFLSARRPINMRVLDVMDLDLMKTLPIRFLDGHMKIGPPYVNP